MKPIWIVDDDQSIRFVLEKALLRESLPTRSFTSPREVMAALSLASEDTGPQVLVSDIRMPGGSGLDLLEQVKKKYPGLPVIIMTAYSDLDSAVSAFQGGAFEYLPKPFDLDELEARVRALIRRAHAMSSPEIVHGRLRIDVAGRRLYCDDQPVELTSREFAMAEMLLMRVGRVVTKQQLVDHLYGWEEGLSSNAVEVLVHRLRKKLEDTGIDIRTIRGMGYLVEHAA